MSSPKLHCPLCRNLLDTHEEIKGTDAVLAPGDITICCNCGSINVLNDDGVTAHLITDEEKLNPDFDEEREEIEKFSRERRAQYEAKNRSKFS